MLHAATLKFLKDLKKNNNKLWFDEHRTHYETVKTDFLLFLTRLISELGKFDPPIGSLYAKECLFRINRDVRFSKDKSPYKNNIAAYFNKGGKKSNGAGYYLHIEPGNSFSAGGIWMPLPVDLAKIRQEIDYNFEDWQQLIGSSIFKKTFPKGVTAEASLTRPPKGYNENNPALHFIKMKNFFVIKQITDAEIQNKSFVKELSATFKAMKPMIDFFNNAIE